MTISLRGQYRPIQDKKGLIIEIVKYMDLWLTPWWRADPFMVLEANLEDEEVEEEVVMLVDENCCLLSRLYDIWKGV